MNNPDNKDAPEIPDEILEAAAIWQARLRDADPDSNDGRQTRAAFNAWLLADTRHRQAYAEMAFLWDALEEPVAQVLAEQQPTASTETEPAPSGTQRQKQAPTSYTFPRWATAACLILTLFTAMSWQQDWATQWQSDYTTAVGEQTSVVMEDNSRITLNSHSAIATDYSTSERRVRLLTGEAWFDVAADDNRPFIVETDQGTVRVTGTQFNVRLDGDATIVSLDEGRVELRADHTNERAAVALIPGQQAQLSEHAITEPVPFDRTAVTAWLRGQFVFYNTPLAEVVDTLNRHRQGRIVITSEALDTLKVSGVFSTRDPDAALEVITKTLPVQQTRLTDFLVLLR